ncbi:SCO-spondin-like isoform X2 [Mytilus trossulus]|uniref:SCO-spondin-like isoform X2 n=1 Tax=Mytilus trossulus TaxID=6551 RepID=UPI003007F106
MLIMGTGVGSAATLLLVCIAMMMDVSQSGAPDNRGTLFIVAFGENSGKSLDTELFVTTSRTTTVNVKVTAPLYTAQSINEQFTVTSGYVKQLALDNDLRMIGTSKSFKGVQISADDDVIVYGVNKEYYSCDAYLALPIDVLGDDYYTVSWYPSSYHCQIDIIGVEDSTTVKVKISSHIANDKVTFNGQSYYSGDTLTTSLQKYEVLQLQSYGDLSGSRIQSNKPVGVLGGNQRTSIGSGGSSDHIVEMLPHVGTWGKTFVTCPIPLRTTGDYFKFIASEDNTQVTISGGYSSSFTIANSGKFVQRTIPSGVYTKVVANKPITVYQFCLSEQSSNEESDPMLMLIPPMEQYGADYTFSTPKYSYGSYSSKFMFIVKESEKAGLLHNGVAFPGSTIYHSIAGTDYVAGYIAIPEGSHVVRHSSPISIFGGYLYGQAKYETYGFPTGMRMAPINEICVPSATVVGDGIDNDCDGLIDEELCTTENQGRDDDGDGVAEEDCATPSPINGNWATWASYGSCSISCTASGSSASGTKTRVRTCSDPTPKYDGTQCTGDSSQSASCTSSSYCPINGGWNNWGSWGSCSVTCASGTQTKTRACNNPSAAHGGADCSGGTTTTKACTLSACPINGGYTSWTSWATCSVTCAGGSQGRTRSCTNPAPQYNGLSCSGAASDSQSCNTHNCPINGGYTSWTSWGTCSVTCAGGSQGRTRSCTNPAPQYNGLSCSGASSDTQSCNTLNCPINGGYTSWTSWATCSVTCGGGTQGRTRSCTNPAPQYNGLSCSGAASDSQSCNTHNCPINGGYTSWSSWDTCTVTCGGGTQDRTRSCTNPAPQYGGLQCSGAASSQQSCNTHHCPIDGVWTSWSGWGTCTVTCGGGSQDRTRSCTNPAPQYGGANCVGVTSETQGCNSQLCIIDGAWSTWGSWGGCSTTCGGGKYSRARTCSDPRPQNGGLACSGDSSEFGDCNTNACPVASSGQYVQLCPSGWFTCQGGSVSCIDEAFVCDCEKDCDDGSDETTSYATCDANVLATCPSSAHMTASFPLTTLLLTVVSIVTAWCVLKI